MKKGGPSNAVRAAFDGLMKAYPARGDNPRAPALAVFARLLEEGEDAAALTRAAARFAAVMRAEKREKHMIPHTRTWLSQRRFEDYTDALASAPEGPNPDHPLAFLAEEIGLAAWRSYIAPLAVDLSARPIVIQARTAFALNHIRKTCWDRQIVARLGDITWTVAS